MAKRSRQRSTAWPIASGFSLPLAGISTVKEIKDSAVDVRATGRLNKLYVELLRENPEWATEARRVDLNHFVARLVFCFFAEDTNIFDKQGIFTRTVETMSERDGSNTHDFLAQVTVPRDMTKDEAKRLTAFIDALALGWACVTV